MSASSSIRCWKTRPSTCRWLNARARYVELGKQWKAAGHTNRMIKVPATPAGLAALEDLSAAGITLNVTLIFSPRQYTIARDSVWRGAQKRATLTAFKSVYSIFVSRVDVYTEQHVPQLSPVAQGLVGIVNAKQICGQMNQQFWADKKLPLKQEIIFASTGTKKTTDKAWKYVEAFAGSDIETNPCLATNDHGREASGQTFSRSRSINSHCGQVVAEIERLVDLQKLEDVLMAEGIKKFADPQKAAAPGADHEQTQGAGEVSKRSPPSPTRRAQNVPTRQRGRIRIPSWFAPS